MLWEGAPGAARTAWLPLSDTKAARAAHGMLTASQGLCVCCAEPHLAHNVCYGCELSAILAGPATIAPFRALQHRGRLPRLLAGEDCVQRQWRVQQEQHPCSRVRQRGTGGTMHRCLQAGATQPR
jgi:hypothetical protein